MADALMNWDKRQARWRKDYKGKTLRIKAADLGGTNATDTLAAANQWYKEQKARIDRESAVKTFRPGELELRAVLGNIQSEIKTLQRILRDAPPFLHPILARQVELMQKREVFIEQTLKKSVLPQIDDSLRNPVHVSPDHIENEAAKEATKAIIQKLREKDFTRISDEELRTLEGYIGYDDPRFGIDESVYLDYDDNAEFFRRMYNLERSHKYLEEDTIEHRVQTEIVGVKDEVLSRKKKEFGLIESEFDRGVVSQVLVQEGAPVPDSRQLDYHLKKFIATKRQDCALRMITPGRLGKISTTIEFYRKWTPITSVDRIGTKDHIDAYYSYLVTQVLAKEIKPEYARNLFGDFKTFVFWLADEEVLKEYPRCLQRKSKQYQFPKSLQTPETIPLELVRRIWGAADPRMKLYILLTLNTGGGASEIGKLKKREYDPVAGRITRKRSKTEDSAKTPVVSYKLWPETKALLDQEIANRINYPTRPESANLLLVNPKNGKPLWFESVNDGKCSRTDSIARHFKSLIERLQEDDPDMPEVTYYALRRTAATEIYNEPQYRECHELWLGHAPKTVAEKHYIAPSSTILDACLVWLYDKIFGLPESPAEV